MSAFANAVHNALAHLEIGDATTDVKRIVCDELARVDPVAQIHRTEYFNHTYVPDLVLDWSDQEPREVFLRFVSTPERLLADGHRLGPSGPIILDLSAAALANEGPAEVRATSVAASQASERSPQLLVTDTEAMAHIRPGKAENMIERLVASNILRSGRGHLNETIANAAVEASRASYDGAVAADPEAVSAAVDLTRQVLQPSIERRVERSLQLLWWVGGGAPEKFPISIPDDMELNPSDTRDFLQKVFADEHQIDDDSFWSRLADRLTFDTLVEVGDFDQSPNLDRLMKQLAVRLELSHVILDKRDRPLPPFDRLAWGLEDNFLRLRGPEWECRFTPHGNRFSQRREEGRPLTLSDADARSSGYLVEEAEIDEATRQVLLSRKSVDPSGQRGRSLRALAAGFADEADVRLIAVLVNDSSLRIDFDRMMVGAEPDTTVYHLAMAATRLLASVDSQARAELETFLGA